MKYRKLSPTGDYSFGGGNLNFYIDVPAAVGQAALTRLKLWLGEWSLDTTQGTPYLDGILGKHSKSDADQTIQTQVLGTENLTGIRKYESIQDTVKRSLSVEVSIDTAFGPTAVTIQNYTNY